MHKNSRAENHSYSGWCADSVRLMAGRIANWVMPSHCVLCQEVDDNRTTCPPICASCVKDLPLQGRSCKICAIPITVPGICGACLANPPHFDCTIALWRYRPPVDKLLQSLKFNAALYLAPWFAEKLLNVTHSIQDMNNIGNTLLLPMPLHRARLSERGFNQTREIARFVSRSRSYHALAPSDMVTRQRASLPQSDLPMRERAENVRGAFNCNVDLTGRSIIVLDDVMTTGATLNEIARVLKFSGATNVTNWVLARTPSPERE
jgi:ComF family protein